MLRLDSVPKEFDISNQTDLTLQPLMHHRMQAAKLRTTSGIEAILTSNPFNLMALQNLQIVHGIPHAKVYYASPATISAAQEVTDVPSVEMTLASLSDSDLQLIAKYGDGNPSSDSELEDLAQQAPVIRLFNAILMEGHSKRASDIHVEATAHGISLRYRIDGVLYDQVAPPTVLFTPLVSRIKILAGMNIAEKRLPQDGRIRTQLGADELDIRVATAPSIHGESVALRLLSQRQEVRTLADLGMSPELQLTMSSLLAQPNGMILATGPTGSGKSTTLYAALNAARGPERKIITLEDPVEYEMEGITQIQVKPKIGFDFVHGLRSLLRHDPDVILVGEIRDTETASMAVHSALTGHLVLSSLHTNDAPTAVTRLRDMGVEPFLLSSTIKAVLAQRLVRVLCDQCKQPTGQPVAPFTAVGCEACDGIGYRGRSGIFELFECDPVGQQAVIHEDDAGLRRLAQANGMRSMYEDGLLKVQAGITTLAEVERVMGGAGSV